jgi:acyl-CoA synthetase (AMP-forming)/AMP-acid ligase II
MSTVQGPAARGADVLGPAEVGRRSFAAWLDAPRDDRGIMRWDGDEAWTTSSYAEVAHAARVCAARLRDALGGQVRCPRVGVVSERADRVLAGLGAAWLLGGTPHVVAQPRSFGAWERYRELALRNLALAEADAVLFDEDSEALVARLLGDDGRAGGLIAVPLSSSGDGVEHAVPDLGDGTVVLHQFTSGSTGPPKLLSVTAANLEANLAGQREWMGWRPGRDAWSSWLPLHHDMGLVGGLLMPAAHGSDLWSSTPGRFLRDPWGWLAPLADGRATVTAAPTFGYAYATSRVPDARRAGADLSTWRVGVIGAEVVTRAALDAFARRFGSWGLARRALCPAYGMAEATLAVTGASPATPPRSVVVPADAAWRIGGGVAIGDASPDGDARPVDGGATPTAPAPAGLRDVVSCGRPIAGATVRVVDDAGASVPEGTFGEIHVGGTSLARVGEDQTGRESAWHATGDGGFLHGGELFVVGRLGDGVKYRGAFVDVEGLELQLLEAVGVAPGRAAVAVGEDVDGVRAVLAIRGDATPGAGRERAEALVRAALGGGARLETLALGDAPVPRTSSGKPQRKQIWAAWSARRDAASALPAPQPPPSEGTR